MYMAKEVSVETMMKSMMYVVVGVVLIPVIFGVITTANITDATTALVVSLIPVLFAISILYGTVKSMF